MGLAPASSTPAVHVYGKSLFYSTSFVHIFLFLQYIQNAAKMLRILSLLLLLCTGALAAAQPCPDYADYAAASNAPFSGGVYNLFYQRPAPSCWSFTPPAVESTIARLTSTIHDPDLPAFLKTIFLIL